MPVSLSEDLRLQKLLSDRFCFSVAIAALFFGSWSFGGRLLRVPFVFYLSYLDWLYLREIMRFRFISRQLCSLSRKLLLLQPLNSVLIGVWCLAHPPWLTFSKTLEDSSGFLAVSVTKRLELQKLRYFLRYDNAFHAILETFGFLLGAILSDRFHFVPLQHFSGWRLGGWSLGAPFVFHLLHLDWLYFSEFLTVYLKKDPGLQKLWYIFFRDLIGKRLIAEVQAVKSVGH